MASTEKTNQPMIDRKANKGVQYTIISCVCVICVRLSCLSVSLPAAESRSLANAIEYHIAGAGSLAARKRSVAMQYLFFNHFSRGACALASH